MLTSSSTDPGALQVFYQAFVHVLLFQFVCVRRNAYQILCLSLGVSLRASLRVCVSAQVLLSRSARQRVCACARLALLLRRGARGLVRCAKARRDARECGVRRDAARREARAEARRGATRPSTNLSLSERVRVLAGSRPCSQVSRTTQKGQQNSKLRGYIWGRFAASFWLGISKTPPLFEIFEKRAAGMLWEHEYEYAVSYTHLTLPTNREV